MPTSKMANVIKIALEDKGHNYSASTVQRWLEQKSCPPPSLAEVFNSIVANIDHHLVAAQTKALLGKERNVKALKKATKEHFSAKGDQDSDNFRTFTDFQREQLRQYVNGEIELSEMKDPEVPANDS